MSDWSKNQERADWRAALNDTDVLTVLLEHSGEPAYVVDSTRKILFWNRAAEELTGYQWHEVSGRFCQDDILAHIDANGKGMCGAECPLSRVLADGWPRDARIYLRHKNGHRIPVQVRAKAVRDSLGERVAAVEFFHQESEGPRRVLPFLDAYGCMDSETGAAVRQYGELRVRQNFDEFKAFGVPFGWLRIGLDRVELLEKGFGYAVLTQAVALVARTLEHVLGFSDLLIRWEPTEFRLVSANADPANLMALGRDLAIAVGGSNLKWWGDALGVTVSIGGASAEVGDTLDSLEDRASEAFELSKGNGGNRASFFGWQDSNPFSILK